MLRLHPGKGGVMAEPSPFIPNPVVRALVALIALGAIIAFAWLTWIACQEVMDAADGVAPTPSDAFVYVATAIGALVGGIVAVGFGVPAPPSGPTPGTPTPGTPTPGTPTPGPNPSLLKTSVDALGSLALPIASAIRAVIGSIYAIVYVGFGIFAGVVWVGNSNETSDVVKNLAVTFIGLVIPIVAGYARPNE
jgi:hypothetical protein